MMASRDRTSRLGTAQYNIESAAAVNTGGAALSSIRCRPATWSTRCIESEIRYEVSERLAPIISGPNIKAPHEIKIRRHNRRCQVTRQISLKAPSMVNIKSRPVTPRKKIPTVFRLAAFLENRAA